MLFKGSATALITPFAGDGIDYEAFSKLIEFQLSNGTDALVVLGSTGEPSTLTKLEKETIINFAIEKVNKRVPVIIGTGGNNTKTVIKDSIYAEKCGADGLLIVTPYYNKCTQNGLVEHYRAICESVATSVIVYNVPARTGVNILPSTLEKIIKLKNVVAIKEASGNITQACEYAKLISDRFAMYCGDDEILLPMLSIGASGVISVTSNIIPKFMHNFCYSYFNGDTKTAFEMQKQSQNFAKSMFCEVNPIPVKAASKLLGLTNGKLRLPLTELEEKNIELIKKTMQEVGVL